MFNTVRLDRFFIKHHTLWTGLFITSLHTIYKIIHNYMYSEALSFDILLPHLFILEMTATTLLLMSQRSEATNTMLPPENWCAEWLPLELDRWLRYCRCSSAGTMVLGWFCDLRWSGSHWGHRWGGSPMWWGVWWHGSWRPLHLVGMVWWKCILVGWSDGEDGNKYGLM